MADIKQEIPAEFKKITKDFIGDIVITFPEYQALINKWWKTDSDTGDINNDSIQFMFKHCLSVYPERFFDILYKNNEIFAENSMVNTEFLPGISFKYLWSCDISEATRTTIWKYLQLIILAIVGCVNNKEAFGDTSKIFDSISEDDFRRKLQETMEGMQNIFQNKDGVDMNNIPSAEDIHGHISGMLNGKLGNLAREIAEETAEDLDIDMENVTDMKDVFQNLFKNPGKLMGLVKNVGEKLDSRIKSGEINQSELLSEATEMMNKMKNTPGMENIQEMLSKMGLGGKGAKVDMNAMEAQLNRNMKKAEMKERIKKRAEMKKTENTFVPQVTPNPNALTDEQLISIFSTGEKVEKSQRGQNPEGKKSKKGKSKK